MARCGPLRQQVRAWPPPDRLFRGDIVEPAYAKTAFGLRDWAPERCVGEFACVGAKVSAGLAPMTPEQARGAGARSMVIGVANPGGLIPDGWLPCLLQALEAGLDPTGGMHARLDRKSTRPNSRH